jgi:hypothetical protein
MVVDAVVAYPRAGARRVCCRVSVPKVTPPCRTKPGQFDPLYPRHLRGLPRVRRSKKKNNFLPPAGFDLV